MLPDLHTGLSRGRSDDLVFPSLSEFSTVKGFGIVNKTEIDIFMELSCFFDYPTDVGNLISGSSAFSETSLNIRVFTVHVLVAFILFCFFDDPVDVGNLISGSSAFPKTSLNIWNFMVHVLLKPGLENFEHLLAFVSIAFTSV